MAKVVDAIRALECDRFRAMVDGDGEALDAQLSDKVFFVHTNGKRETKQQFIDAIVAGRRRYRQIEIQSQDLLPVGDATCVVTGRALIEMETNNGGLVFPIAYTAVHTHEHGQWRLLAWQATRCATET
ncbi:nuclear transport factor 2 family protein [Burkholderia vietnamiensis]|uniref:nuclear transport factor 2 family protein n=1 Tax=Burkholderia vietnamiensis TaxID=60552 RepID=UPI000F802937|nr:nuclear transport factor 2 family protein [Burkholderia vietnamiensis]MDN7665548.1 nuclear transport factor 2 family protein [Burkholderia vietnamiensis]MDN8075937.1 nuclear transport factor 2 family protein [Burkholderia vietnamiensis]HDR8983818.1 nuclear transport factor 2 family protein [Burkholderia vietnamiensis]HDR9150360.1 nuclear transport factor 2 family protein [Burkholderia vietnamiensis]